MNRLTPVLILLLAVAGCSNDSAPSQPHAADGAATSAGKTANPSLPPPVSPPSSASRAPGAADDSDVKDCLDGSCQIAVSGPVTILINGPAGRSELSVLGIEHDNVEYSFISPSGSSEGSTGPGCMVSVSESGSSSSCGHAPSELPFFPSTGAGLTMEVLSVSGGTAVLKLSKNLE